MIHHSNIKLVYHNKINIFHFYIIVAVKLYL